MILYEDDDVIVSWENGRLQATVKIVDDVDLEYALNTFPNNLVEARACVVFKLQGGDGE